MTDGKIALITGGNRGMGLEAGRQLASQGHTVILTSRDPDKGARAVSQLAAEGLKSAQVQLDVRDGASIKSAIDEVIQNFGRIDILINNAGILGERSASILDVTPDIISNTLATNLLGPILLMQQVVPHMRQNGYGRIVNVSSMMGQIGFLADSNADYRLSKTALNAATILLHKALPHEANIKVNAASPGWVRTDMGGAGAARSVEDGADTAVWLATLPDDGPSGGFFHDRKLIDW